MRKNTRTLRLAAAAMTLILAMTALVGCSAVVSDPVVAKVGDVEIKYSAFYNAFSTYAQYGIIDTSDAVTAQLEKMAADQGMQIQVEHYNGQNDTSILAQIGADVAAENYDAIIPIATLAAQYVLTGTEGKDVPIVYAAVSDPEGAGLTGYSNVTGVSDALNTPFILDMMFAADPDIQTVGLLYSLSEPNSEKPIAEAKAYLDAKGIPYIEKTGNTADA